MTRVFNFGPGPATLPEQVLEQVRDELLDWHGSGMSVMEMSHRGATYGAIAERALADLRALLAVPDNYRVLFLQGGAAGEFAAVPLNILRGASSADYLVTGQWSQKAVREARKYCHVNVVASGSDNGFTDIPPPSAWQFSRDAGYCHYTSNETIHGVQFHDVPAGSQAPLAVDMSSDFLSRPVAVSRYGVIYAGAQKNLGPAGVTVVIVRDDLLGQPSSTTPMVLDYTAQVAADSMLNTPASFNWYVCGLVLQWLRSRGGLQTVARINQRKASKLYRFIDQSDFYTNPVAPSARSHMNVPFLLADERRNGEFLTQCENAGLAGLKGHRSVGGMRASLYNAMPEAGVDALIDCMRDFARRKA